MTMTTVNTIANAIIKGMDFNTVIAVVKTFTNDFTAVVPSDDDYGFISIGDTWGNSADISFDADDKVDGINVYTMDDFD